MSASRVQAQKALDDGFNYKKRKETEKEARMRTGKANEERSPGATEITLTSFDFRGIVK